MDTDNAMDGGTGGPFITPEQLMERADLVEASDGWIVVVDKPIVPDGVWMSSDGQMSMFEPPPSPTLGEIGGTGQSSLTGMLQEDYNNELRWPYNLDIYKKMRTDGSVRGASRLVKTPILSARWYIEPSVNPGETEFEPEDVEIADELNHMLFSAQDFSFRSWLQEALLELDYGCYFFEIVWDEITDPEGRRRVVPSNLAPRHPSLVDKFQWNPNGSLKAIEFFTTRSSGKSVPIPVEKLICLTFEGEAGDPRGMSMLRSAYKHWYLKELLYKVDALQKERHGIGIPVVHLPMGFSPQDKILAQQLGKNLRANEKAHIVLPPRWEVSFLKIEGQPVNAILSADHHNLQVFNSVLAGYMLTTDNHQTAAETAERMFIRSVSHVAEQIADEVNRKVVAPLAVWNWGLEPHRIPILKVRRIGEAVDWRTLSFTWRNLTGAGIIKPDDRLEDWFRAELDAPHRDPSTAREVATPQMSGEDNDGETGDSTGLPRQSTAANSTQGKTPGSKSVGQDGSGG